MPGSENKTTAEKNEELEKQSETQLLMIHGLYRELISLKVRYGVKLTDNEKSYLEKNM